MRRGCKLPTLRSLFISHAVSQKVTILICPPKHKEKLFRLALLPLTAAVLVATGCTSSMTTTATQSSAETGPAFVVGTDAPLASVVSFPVANP